MNWNEFRMRWLNIENAKYVILWSHPWEETKKINQEFNVIVYYISRTNSFWKIVSAVFNDSKAWDDIRNAIKEAQEKQTLESWKKVEIKQLQFCKKHSIGIFDIYQKCKPKTSKENKTKLTNKKNKDWSKDSSADNSRYFEWINDFDENKHKLFIINGIGKLYDLKPNSIDEKKGKKFKLYKWIVPIINCISTSNASSKAIESKNWKQWKIDLWKTKIKEWMEYYF